MPSGDSRMTSHEDELLRKLIKWKRTVKTPSRTVRLSDTISQIMQKHISPKYDKYGPLFENWELLLPPELARHCKIAAVNNGQLRIKVDAPAYGNEIRLCQAELVEQLKEKCPKARIRNIKIVVG